MLPAKFIRSTYVRLAFSLTVIFAAIYLVAGWYAYRAVDLDLEERVSHSVAMRVEEFERAFLEFGEAALVDAVRAADRGADREDEVYSVSLRDGGPAAGPTLLGPLPVRDGEYPGEALMFGLDDSYWVSVRRLGDATLVVAHSFEEADEITEVVLLSFLVALIFSALAAMFAAITLAFSGQRRIDQISAALDSFAGGELNQRIRRRQDGDDLDGLASRINSALDRLQSTVEGIRQVSSDIAHDLRTPISRLGLQIEAIQAELPEGAIPSESLERAADQIRKIATTFDSLLRIGQIEARAHRDRSEVLSLVDVARALEESYSAVAEDHDQALVMCAGPGVAALVSGDRGLIIQLGANLIENAINHCPPGSRIHITVGEDAEKCWLEAADDGPGIPASERESVLRRFYRLDKTRADGGSGLGLAIVKAIADYHKANLFLRDGEPGLVVRIEFERRAGPAPELAEG